MSDLENATDAAATVVTTSSFKSPYYLYPSDHPGDNFEEWSSAMTNSLIPKCKLSFINGRIKQPAADDDLFENWQMVNSMLIGWLVQSIDPSIRSSITYFSTDKKLWDDLKQRFSVGNGPRKLQLRRDIAVCRQGGRSVLDYYIALKKLWEELAQYIPPPSCTCTGCMCNISAAIVKECDEEHIHQFLIGLDNATFGSLRSTILAQELLLPIARIYSLVIQEERLKSVVISCDTLPAEVTIFAARKPPPPSSKPAGSSDSIDKKNPHCTHCDKTGHNVTMCFKIHGYPDWWKEHVAAGRTTAPSSVVFAPSGRSQGRATGIPTRNSVRVQPSASRLVNNAGQASFRPSIV